MLYTNKNMASNPTNHFLHISAKVILTRGMFLLHTTKVLRDLYDPTKIYNGGFRMKKINMVVVCLLSTALTVAGCASTPQSEAYLQTPIGNGSESGFVMTATLPDGTTREMHLFKTWQEMDAFTTEIGFERTSWHMKFDASLLQTAKFSAKNAKFNEEGYLAEPYSFDEIGEIGKVMKEKGLPLSVYADKIGKEWRTVGVVAQDKKYTNFRFQ